VRSDAGQLNHAQFRILPNDFCAFVGKMAGATKGVLRGVRGRGQPEESIGVLNRLFEDVWIIMFTGDDPRSACLCRFHFFRVPCNQGYFSSAVEEQVGESAADISGGGSDYDSH
jgi:hypothetical protein